MTQTAIITKIFTHSELCTILNVDNPATKGITAYIGNNNELICQVYDKTQVKNQIFDYLKHIFSSFENMSTLCNGWYFQHYDIVNILENNKTKVIDYWAETLDVYIEYGIQSAIVIQKQSDTAIDIIFSFPNNAKQYGFETDVVNIKIAEITNITKIELPTNSWYKSQENSYILTTLTCLL